MKRRSETVAEIKLPRLRVDQYRIASSPANINVVAMGRRWGKALDVETPIPTPRGFVDMGDLDTGDLVFDETGNPCKIVFATDVMYGRDCYEVVFDDYTSIVADADHLWSVYDVNANSGKSVVTNTRRLFKGTLATPGRYAIKPSAPIQTGVLDASDVVSIVDHCLLNGTPLPQRILWESTATREIALQTVEMDLLAVPQNYFHEGSFRDKSPTLKFHDFPLALSVYRLATSLGLVPTLTESNHDWILTYRYPGVHYSLSQTDWVIQEIIPVASRPVRCIQVDSSSHLYLASESFIPTHNTTMGLGIVLANAVMGAKCAWVVPIYKNARPLWKMVMNACLPAIQRGLVRVSQQEMTVTFPDTGGFLGIYTATNENSIRGEAFHVVVVDEAALVAESTWTDVLQPTLADYNGKGFLISTPRGRGSWFYREWNRGRDLEGKPAEEGYKAFQAPSSDNPNENIKKAAEKAKGRVSDRTYRQEWLAEFVEDGGAVFQHVRKQAVAQTQMYPTQGHSYMIGCDWGRIDDWSVFAVYDITSGELVNLRRYRALNYVEQQIPKLRTLIDTFKPLGIVGETNGVGRPLVDYLQSLALPVIEFTMSLTTKNSLVELIAVGLETGTLRIINDPVLIDELESFEIHKLPSGRVTYRAPQGQHDDTVIALGLALWGVKGESREATMIQNPVLGRTNSPQRYSNPTFYRRTFRSRSIG